MAPKVFHLRDQLQREPRDSIGPFDTLLVLCDVVTARRDQIVGQALQDVLLEFRMLTSIVVDCHNSCRVHRKVISSVPHCTIQFRENVSLDSVHL